MKHIMLLISLFLIEKNLIHAQEYGMASIFTDNFQGKKTASGETYDMNKLTAAHKSFPFGSKVKITRLDNKQSIIVRINDRGPYIKGRVIELSKKAAREIGLVEDEVKVRLDLVEKANENEDIRPPKPAPVLELPERKELASKGDDKKKKAAANPPKKEIKSESAKEYNAPEPVKLVPKDDETVKGTKSSGDLYKMQVLKPERDGFGVQVAAMSDINNVMRKVAEMQEGFFKNVLVATDKDSAGRPTYKIILGPFPDVNTAEIYKKNAKKKKMNGFVINLRTMEKM